MEVYEKSRKKKKVDQREAPNVLGIIWGSCLSWTPTSSLDPHVQDRETTSNYSGPQETTETAEHILNAIYESGGEGTAGESEVMISRLN